MKNSSFSNKKPKRAIYPIIVRMFEYMLLLTKNKRKFYACTPNNCNDCDYLYSLMYSYLYVGTMPVFQMSVR